MPSDSYIDANRYNEITDDDASNASDQRLKRASMLLDVRCGLDNYATSDQDNDLLLLDYDNLNARKKEAVDQWVAWFVKALVDNNDSVSISESITLGRFSVDPGENENELFPDQIKYADQMVVSYGLVRRDVDSNPNSVYFENLRSGIYVN